MTRNSLLIFLLHTVCGLVGRGADNEVMIKFRVRKEIYPKRRIMYYPEVNTGWGYEPIGWYDIDYTYSKRKALRTIRKYKRNRGSN